MLTITKVNYLNQKSEDGGELGCTIGPRIKKPLLLKQKFLRESSVYLNNYLTYLPLMWPKHVL